MSRCQARVSWGAQPGLDFQDSGGQPGGLCQVAQVGPEEEAQHNHGSARPAWAVTAILDPSSGLGSFLVGDVPV